MAMRQQRDARLAALIAQAAAESTQLNPHLGLPPQPYPDALVEALERDAREAEHLWDALDRRRDARSGRA